MNKNFLLLICLLFATASYSQKAQNTYFLKDNGLKVNSKDKADFIRVVQEPDSGSIYYNLLEYYTNGAKKTIGHVSKYEPFLTYEGQKISYFKNGNRREIVTFENGKPIGDRYEYYANGKLKLRMTNAESSNQYPPGSDFGKSNFKLWDYFDSTGVQLIKDGNGTYKTFENNPPINEEGNYVNGQKDGIWKGLFNKSNASYEEVYDKGKFISGKAKLDNGKIEAYTKIEEMPEYPGGMKSFYEYVARNYKYTSAAQNMGISGRVYMGFVVQADGSLTDIKIIKDLGYGTGDEAIRVLRQSRNWNPGRQHGVPVRVSYTLPIQLNIR